MRNRQKWMISFTETIREKEVILQQRAEIPCYHRCWSANAEMIVNFRYIRRLSRLGLMMELENCVLVEKNGKASVTEFRSSLYITFV